MSSAVEKIFHISGFRFDTVRSRQNLLEVTNLYAYSSSGDQLNIYFDYVERDGIELRHITVNAVDQIPVQTGNGLILSGSVSSISVTRKTFCTGEIDKFATEDAELDFIISDGGRITIKPSEAFPDLLSIRITT